MLVALVSTHSLLEIIVNFVVVVKQSLPARLEIAHNLPLMGQLLRQLLLLLPLLNNQLLVFQSYALNIVLQLYLRLKLLPQIVPKLSDLLDVLLQLTLLGNNGFFFLDDPANLILNFIIRHSQLLIGLEEGSSAVLKLLGLLPHLHHRGLSFQDLLSDHFLRLLLLGRELHLQGRDSPFVGHVVRYD